MNKFFSQIKTHADPNFVDKTAVYLPSEHRFSTLSHALSDYQGADILSLTQNNDLIEGADRQQLNQAYEQLLINKPQPHACVLVVITDEISPRLLLTRRASNLSSHAGEVSLVGGKRDKTDRSSYEVATREAFEEVGLLRQDSTLIGFLPMQISKKGLLVRPVVASITPAIADSLIASEDEIQRLFWADLTYLKITPPIDYHFERPNFGRAYLHTPAWLIDDRQIGEPEVVWGLTGRIIANFLHIGYGVHHQWYYHLQAHH